MEMHSGRLQIKLDFGDCTLCEQHDGVMLWFSILQVVDEDLETGIQTRRFLVYDILLLNSQSCLDLTFEVSRLAKYPDLRLSRRF